MTIHEYHLDAQDNSIQLNKLLLSSRRCNSEVLRCPLDQVRMVVHKRQLEQVAVAVFDNYLGSVSLKFI